MGLGRRLCIKGTTRVSAVDVVCVGCVRLGVHACMWGGSKCGEDKTCRVKPILCWAWSINVDMRICRWHAGKYVAERYFGARRVFGVTTNETSAGRVHGGGHTLEAGRMSYGENIAEYSIPSEYTFGVYIYICMRVVRSSSTLSLEVTRIS